MILKNMKKHEKTNTWSTLISAGDILRPHQTPSPRKMSPARLKKEIGKKKKQRKHLSLSISLSLSFSIYLG